MPKVIHFEINADEPLRAKKFYESLFNWKIEKWDGPVEYWTIDAGDDDEVGIEGGIQKREQAEDQIAVEEGDTIRFLLIEQQGFYKVCSAYLSTNREGATSWQHRHEFSFAHFDIVKAKNEAALTIGLELIESME